MDVELGADVKNKGSHILQGVHVEKIERLKSAFALELSKSEFSERGKLYEQLLMWLKEEEGRYKIWLKAWIDSELSARMATLNYLDPAVEYYEEEDFAELWSLDFFTQDHQFSIPIHWIREDLQEALKRDWGEEIVHMRNTLSKQNIKLDDELWEVLRKIEWLVNTDLRFWSTQVWNI